LDKPDIKFLLAHPAHFFALGFGSGFAPKAPGTFGTLIGFPLFWLIFNYSFSSQLMMIAVLFMFGIYVCDKTGNDLGVSDHGAMVWDEIVAMMLVLAFAPHNWLISFCPSKTHRADWLIRCSAIWPCDSCNTSSNMCLAML